MYLGKWQMKKVDVIQQTRSRFLCEILYFKEFNWIQILGPKFKEEEKLYHTTTKSYVHNSNFSAQAPSKIISTDKGTFIKDVRQFWAILDLPTYPCPMFSILCPITLVQFFLRHLPTPKSDILYERSLGWKMRRVPVFRSPL